MQLFLFLALSLTAHADDTKFEAVKLSLDHISKAIDLYFVDCKELPTTLDQLKKAPANCKHWGPDPYLDSILDPWNRTVKYKKLNSKSYQLRSLGADGKEGGVEDDMDVVYDGKAPVLGK